MNEGQEEGSTVRKRAGPQRPARSEGYSPLRSSGRCVPVGRGGRFR